MFVYFINFFQVSATLAMSIIASIFSMAPITQGWVALVFLGNCKDWDIRSWALEYYQPHSCSQPEVKNPFQSQFIRFLKLFVLMLLALKLDQLI